MFQIGDRVVTTAPVEDASDGTILLAESEGTITRIIGDIVNIKTQFNGDWQVGEGDIKLINPRTQAQEFEASFNFCHLINKDVAEIRFHDGSVLTYGKDWLD